MGNPDYATLKGVTYLKKDLLTQNLLYSLIEFYNWGFLNIGGFQNITRTPAVSGAYGGQRYNLTAVRDPRFTNGQVWEGFRGDWVWETGIDFAVQPIRPSGVWVNNVFQTLAATGAYVDYKRGRIIFNSPISTNSVVHTEFSPRYVTFESAEQPFAVSLLTESHRIERDFLHGGSGLADVRQQLPYVAVEIVPTRGRAFEGYQLGGGQWVRKDVLFHIFAESPDDKNQIKDVIEYQNDRSIMLYDRGAIKATASFPYSLDYRGAVVSSPIMYPDLVSPNVTGSYFWGSCFLENTTSIDLAPINDRIFRAVVRTTCVTILGNI